MQLRNKKQLCKIQVSNSQNKLYYALKQTNNPNDTNYLLDEKRFTNQLVENKDICFPIEIDCEYKPSNLACLATDEFLHPTLPVTTQMRQPVSNVEHVFLHEEVAEYYKETGGQIRHSVLKHDFHVLDFLEAEGENVSLEIDENAHKTDKINDPKDKQRLPVFKVLIYAFFALADFPKLFSYTASEELKKATGRRKIKMNRRMVAKGSKYGRGWNAPFILTLNDIKYRVSIEIIDTFAVHGNIGYKDFCSNTGIDLTVKDQMQPYIKSMEKAYIDQPLLFDKYATDDLNNYNALNNNANNMKDVWKHLGIENYYKPPALTIGKTVDDIFQALIFQKMQVTAEVAYTTRGKNAFKRKEFFALLTYRASADYLSSKVRRENHDKQSLCVLSKCDGGRCRNAKPTLINLKGCLVDIDIAGAYTSAMSVLQYPLGNPVLMDCTGSVLLKHWLQKYGKDLIPRLWYARIKTKENLTYEQHLIPSWFGSTQQVTRDYVDTKEGKKAKHTISLDVDSGDNKILTKQIINGALTHDILEVITKEWPKRQQDDFFNKVELVAIGFYPKSLRVDTIEELQTKQTLHQQEHDYNSQKLAGIEIDHPSDCHAWTSFSLGEEFIDVIKVARKQHPKGSPLNTLFKLVGNTAYGDSVSKYFQTSNMIVGNNITAMVRTMMYYTEIALNLCGSITDGQIFDLNKVVHKARGKYLSISNMPRMYNEKCRDLNRKDICKTAPLNNATYKLENNIFYMNDNKYNLENKSDYAEIEQYINEETYKHVQSIFPNNDLLNGRYKKLKAEKGKGLQYIQSHDGIFEFEMKEFLHRSTHHSSANYQYVNNNNDEKTKMRSYETKKNAHDQTLRKEHVAYSMVDNKLVFDYELYKHTSPAELMMREIYNNPKKARLYPDFVKEAMLKPNEFANNYQNKWHKSELLNLGDTIAKTGRFSYWSLTQFTYTCEEQYRKWQKFNQKLKNKYNIGIDMYFLNEERTHVNYKEMIEYCDLHISKGVINPATLFNRHRNNIRLTNHSVIKNRRKAFLAVRNRISEKHFPIIEGVNDYMESEAYAE